MKGLRVIRSKWPINFISLTELSLFKYYLKQATPRSTLSLAKARRRRRARLCRLPKQEGGEYP